MSLLENPLVSVPNKFIHSILKNIKLEYFNPKNLHATNIRILVYFSLKKTSKKVKIYSVYLFQCREDKYKNHDLIFDTRRTRFL